MEKKLLLGIALGLSVISLANAPSKSQNHKMKNLETKLEYTYQYSKSEKIEELTNFYKQEIKDERQQIEDEKNYITNDFSKDNDEVLLARMILGEVAKRPKYEKLEIGSTAITRMSWGFTLKEVILFPRAYSCFNKDSNRLDELKHPFDYGKTEFLNCLEVSKELLQMKYKSLGATHYYNPDIVKKPEWANKMKFVGKVGPHLMYK
jgi:spore germination cell wall hydrolase CwlJ-like protein